MKLSSISHIAATLAGIAGSAISTPVPLHTSALQQVNLLGHGLDVLKPREINGEPVDNLFARFLSPDTMARALKNYADDHREASRKAKTVVLLQPNPSSSREKWQKKSTGHEKSASRLEEKAKTYENLMKPGAGSSHHTKPDPLSDILSAKKSHRKTEKTIRRAGKALDNRYKWKRELLG